MGPSGPIRRQAIEQAAEEIGGGFIAGDEEQDAEANDLLIGERDACSSARMRALIRSSPKALRQGSTVR